MAGALRALGTTIARLPVAIVAICAGGQPALGGEAAPIRMVAAAAQENAAAPSLSLEIRPMFTMDRAAPSAADRGDIVTYVYAVTNTGNVPVANVFVNDAHNGQGPLSAIGTETLIDDAAPYNDSHDAFPNDGRWSSLAPGDVVIFIATYSVTQADMDRAGGQD